MKSRRKKLGLAFQDEFLKISQSSGYFSRPKIDDVAWKDSLLPNYQVKELIDTVSPWRLVFLGSLILITFFGLFLRLFHLQVVAGSKNRERADLNRIQVYVLHAPRGVIYDRNGRVLAENNPGFRLREQFIDREEALKLEAEGNPRFNELEIDTIRSYPYGVLMSHLLGYVDQISPEELGENLLGYKIGDRIGRVGLEKFYETFLRGVDGAEIIEVDAGGKKLRTLRRIEPYPGNNIYLSIDVDLQRVVSQALQEALKKSGSCCGVAIVAGPKKGEILALSSLPTFDANAFTDPKRNEEVTDYFSDPNSPLLNRAIAGVYPPGSTFKITSALAGLTSGKITGKTQFEDTGILNLGPYKFANWYFTQYGKTEGLLDLVKALQRSNDIFFYHIGQAVGEKSLGEVAKKIGFGKGVGIDLPGEGEGLIPDDEWKRKNIGEVWYPGDSLHMAIGQGFILTTPLQILAETAMVAGDGTLLRPHLVTKITRADGSMVKNIQPEVILKDFFKKEDLELIKEGLAKVPQPGGTAWPFFTFSLPTAGKTGTAEFGDPQGKTHAWYTSYAPVDDPKIVVTVLVEGGGEGSTVAAPVVKEIYTWYFNPDKGNLKSLETSPAVSDSVRSLGE